MKLGRGRFEAGEALESPSPVPKQHDGGIVQAGNSGSEQPLYAGPPGPGGTASSIAGVGANGAAGGAATLPPTDGSPPAPNTNPAPTPGSPSSGGPPIGRPSLPRPGALRDEKCCKCSGGDNPDLRWPGVEGSPIVNDMGNTEYTWGERGVPEASNPVGRMNQPRTECCPCDGSKGEDADEPPSPAAAATSEARFVTVASPAGALRAALDGRSPWVEVLALVLSQRALQRVLVRGDAIDAQAALHAEGRAEERTRAVRKGNTAAGGPGPAAGLAAYHAQLDKALLIVRVREMLAQRVIARFESEAAGAPSFEALMAAAPPHAASPRFSARWGPSVAVRAAAKALCERLGPELCAKDVESGGGGGGVPHSELSSELPLEITTAFRLLSRGPASSVCVAVGAVRCLRTLQASVCGEGRVGGAEACLCMSRLSCRCPLLAGVAHSKRHGDDVRAQLAAASRCRRIGCGGPAAPGARPCVAGTAPLQ